MTDIDDPFVYDEHGVPTGMKTGVSISPCAVVMVPARAAPSLASRWKLNVLLVIAP